MAAAKAEVREAYVGPAPEGCGLEEAFALSLLDLLSQDRLPANPYFVFANRLITYVDQREFWLKSDADILALLEEGGHLQLVDPKSKLAKLKGSPYAWGLPHMLIGADLDGLHEIREALRGSLPESFFPSALSQVVADGYYMVELSSLQGHCVLYRFGEMPFPQDVEVQVDVVVSGQSLEKALNIFAGQVVKETRDLIDESIHFVREVEIVTNAEGGPAPDDEEEEGQVFTTEDFKKDQRVEAFTKVLKRATMQRQLVEVKVEAAVEVQGGTGGRRTQAFFATLHKKYVFHFGQGSDLNRVTYEQYGQLEYEALYRGVFTEQKAARTYLQVSKVSSDIPYGSAALESNRSKLRSDFARMWRDGHRVRSLPILHGLVCLEARSVTKMSAEPASLPELVGPTLEEMRGDQWQTVSHHVINDVALAALPDIQRMLCSAASLVLVVVNDVSAICRVLGHESFVVRRRWQSAWKSLGKLKAGAEGGPAAPDQDAADEPSQEESDRAALEEVDRVLLDHVHYLIRSIDFILKKEYNSGLGSMIKVRLESVREQLKGIKFDSNPVLLSTLRDIKHLLTATTKTLSYGLTARSPAVSRLVRHYAKVAENAKKEALKAKRLATQDKKDRKKAKDEVEKELEAAAGEEEPGGEEVQVESYDIVAANEGARYPAGFVKESIGLKYAVDTGLDTVIKALYLEVTKPPLTPNPYARIVTHLRTVGVMVEVPHEDPDDFIRTHMNRMVGYGTPVTLYASRSTNFPHGVSFDDDPDLDAASDLAPVHGCYSAVMFADQALLQRLRAELGPVIEARMWQKGAYDADGISALRGSAYTTKYKRAREILPESHLAHKVEIIEHSLVSGPQEETARDHFAFNLLHHVHAIQEQSKHIVQSVRVPGRGAFQYQETLDDAGRVREAIAKAVNASEEEADVTVSICCSLQDQGYILIEKAFRFHFHSTDKREAQRIYKREAGTFWEPVTYSQVFLKEADALKWTRWYATRGNPEEPVHIKNCSAALKKHRLRARAHEDYLEAMQISLLQNLIKQDFEAVPALMYSVNSAVREMTVLQALSKTIRVVLTEKSKHFELKIKKENLEDTVQGFMEGVTKCFSLPQLCPFNAIIVYVKAILKRLEAHVYSKSKKLMPASLIAELEQIDVWIEACKMSMASSLYQTVSVSFS